MSPSPISKPAFKQELPLSSGIATQWIIAGVISSSARFIPIPLIDDSIQYRCRRYTVKTTLEAHQLKSSLNSLEPYFDNSSGRFKGCFGLIFKIPISLLLFPFRKLIAVVTAVRGVPLEVMRVYLLGRALDRYLSENESTLADDRLLLDDRSHAIRLRTAFDQAFARMDMHMMLAVMRDAVGGFAEIRSAAMVGLKGVLIRKSEATESISVDSKVIEEAKRIQLSFSQTEMVALFEEFDQRFDRAMSDLV